MLNAENNNEYTGLLEAAEAGDLNQLKYILKASLEAKDSKWGWTALHYAAWKGHLEIIKFLVKQGVNLNAKDYAGKTALTVAIDYKQTEVKAYLAEPSYKLNTLNTDLLKAAQEGDLRKVECLVTEGAQVNTKDSKWSWTALHYAAWKGHLEIIKFLARQGANLNAKDYASKTALTVAINYKKKEIEAYLQKVYSELNHDLLKTAETTSNLWKIKQLVENGANVNTKNSSGNTVLHWGVWGNNLKVVKYLVDNGADFNAKNKQMNSVLFWAAWKGNLDIVKYLIDKGADVNTKNNAGETALIKAKNENHLKIVDYLTNIAFLDAVEKNDLNEVENLLSSGAQLNMADECKFTALHHAARKNNLNMVKFLVDKGVNLDAKDWEGKTALGTAIKFGNKKIEDFLAHNK